MKCFETNIQGTLNLFNWAIKFKPKEIIFTSSMSVYGEFAENVSEKNLCKPTSFYGISKLTGEKILLKLKEYKIKVFIFRLFNVYGPGQNFENLVQGMLSIYLAQAYRKNKIEVTGSLKRFRDFVFIDDVVQALTKKYRYRANEDNIYNVGSGKKTYVKDLIKLILTCLKINKKVVVKKSHSGDTWGSFANNKKILKNGWKIKTTLKKGLIKTIEDLKKIK